MIFLIGDQREGVRVGELNSRAVFPYGGSWYRVLSDVGQGIRVSNSNGHTIIINLKCGTLREIKSKIFVEPHFIESDVVIPVRVVSNADMWNFKNC